MTVAFLYRKMNLAWPFSLCVYGQYMGLCGLMEFFLIDLKLTFWAFFSCSLSPLILLIHPHSPSFPLFFLSRSLSPYLSLRRWFLQILDHYTLCDSCAMRMQFLYYYCRFQYLNTTTTPRVIHCLPIGLAAILSFVSPQMKSLAPKHLTSHVINKLLILHIGDIHHFWS